MKNVSDIYLNGEYAKNNPEFGDDNAAWKSKNALKAISLYNLETRKIAEVGCAGGGILISVAEAVGAEKAIGYEPGPIPYAFAKKRETEFIQFRNESVDTSTNEYFDLMLCFDVFEHIEDYFTFLRGLKDKSKNYLFHIPMDMNVQMVARKTPIDRVREKVGHLHYFSKDTALASLVYCGYNVEGWFYTSAAESCYKSGLCYKIANFFRKICHKISPDISVRVLGGYSLMVYAKASDE